MKIKKIIVAAGSALPGIILSTAAGCCIIRFSGRIIAAFLGDDFILVPIFGQLEDGKIMPPVYIPIVFFAALGLWLVRSAVGKKRYCIILWSAIYFIALVLSVLCTVLFSRLNDIAVYRVVWSLYGYIRNGVLELL